MFTQQQLAVVRFCAEECKRQHSGEISVGWMVDAYNFAAVELLPLLAGGGKVELTHCLTLGAMLEPQVNARGFRITPVRFADGTILTNHGQIADQLERLLSLQGDASPAEFYQAFEEIHPHGDGNGRQGAILFNLFGGTMGDPIVPPPFNRAVRR